VNAVSIDSDQLPSTSPTPPSLMNIYSHILARRILSKTCRSRLRFHSNFSSIPQIHATTSPRPYTFHIGVSWAGKPHDPKDKKNPFPLDTTIGTWRDKTLSRPKAVKSRNAGDDFFFVQEVLFLIHIIMRLLTPFSFEK
jgi:protein phosphatase PTC7